MIHTTDFKNPYQLRIDFSENSVKWRLRHFVSRHALYLKADIFLLISIRPETTEKEKGETMSEKKLVGSVARNVNFSQLLHLSYFYFFKPSNTEEK